MGDGVRNVNVDNRWVVVEMSTNVNNRGVGGQNRSKTGQRS